MAHPRELITEAMVALFQAAGLRASANRVDPYKPSDLPAVSVYALTDEDDDAASSEMEEAHVLALVVDGWAAQGGINSLMDEVESAVRGDEYLGGLVSQIAPAGTIVELDSNDPLLARAMRTYSVRYHIALAAT